MLNLLASLVITALPATPGAFSACPDPAPPTADECDVGRAARSLVPDVAVRGARAQRRRRRIRPAAPRRTGVASCEAPTAPAQLPTPNVPPVALFALPTLLPLHVPSHFDADARDLPARALAPPERPPRA